MFKKIFLLNCNYPQFVSLLFSLTLILIVFYFQYFDHMIPCHLCLLQRYFHYFNIFFSLLAIFFINFKYKKFAYFLAYLGAVYLLIGSGFAFYHVGVENHLWTSVCTIDFSKFSNTKDLLKYIENTPVVACDDVSWRFLGLSMATYNFIFSFIIGLFVCVCSFKKFCFIKTL